ncbi:MULTISPECIES: ATP-binding cassette domain-containing protein [Vibrio]|uniref:ATP-binding cassette domain-containing protein n=1 Tax=Vibrio algicola TaxID=2662262 RepID=A0A5Q0TAQ4_9VIBR|nr:MULTISPECIES: ATP-binding cassette domain-containing protein [Vibrio]MBD1576548.1 ATP-binding cassette domain-containing protein [Vibrio sp. S11_S32]
MTICLRDLKLSLATEQIEVPCWTIEPEQHWVIFSTYSHCGSTLGRVLAGDLDLKANPKPVAGDHSANIGLNLQGLPDSIGWVSLHLQQALLEKEIANDDTDFMDKIDIGSTVEALVLECCDSAEQRDELLALTDIAHLRLRGFRQLSTGETRRVMLARALAIRPRLLILDEPYAGLDLAHQQQLSSLINQLSQTIQIIVMTSRQDEVPECITHVAMFNHSQNKQGVTVNTLGEGMSIEQWHAHPVMAQLNQLSQQRSDEVMGLIKRQRYQAQYPDPLVELKNGKVEYTDGLIFKDVNWRINNGQHWQVRGPNGCGKSTLLGLILGDHPQCYSNDITLFGKPRGSGETIWQVKQQIGIVSSALHLQYRVNCSALEVLLSGFFDSIGLYQKPSKKQIDLAKDWLAILHMSHCEKISFKQLDYGQQRLLLIGRALIKQPVLLILDEPYQGLDFINRKLVMNTLNMLAQENLSQLLYVSHHVDDALPAIKNYLDFVGNTEQGYEVEIVKFPTIC